MTDFTARLSREYFPNSLPVWFLESIRRWDHQEHSPAARSLKIRHLLPQRHCHHHQEAQDQWGLEHGGSGSVLNHPLRLPGGWRGWVGVGVAARARQRGVGLVGAAELAVAHVLAGLVGDAGQLLQLGEVVSVAAVGAVTARAVGAWQQVMNYFKSFLGIFCFCSKTFHNAL